MRLKKKCRYVAIIIVAFVFFMGVIVWLAATWGLFRPPVLVLDHSYSERLYNASYYAVSNNTMVDLGEVFDFEWDRVVLIPPYRNLRDILDELDVDINVNINAITRIGHLDWHDLVIFLHNSSIVAALEHPGDMGNLGNFVNMSGAVYKVIYRNEAMFTVSSVNVGRSMEWLYLEHQLTS